MVEVRTIYRLPTTEANTEVVTESVTENVTESITEGLTDVTAEDATGSIIEFSTTESKTEVIVQSTTESKTEVIAQSTTEDKTEVIIQSTTEDVTEDNTEFSTTESKTEDVSTTENIVDTTEEKTNGSPSDGVIVPGGSTTETPTKPIVSVPQTTQSSNNTAVSTLVDTPKINKVTKSGKTKVKVSLKSKVIKGVSCVIQISVAKNFKKNKTISSTLKSGKKTKTLSVKNSKLKSGKVYYVRIRYIKKSDNKVYHSKWVKASVKK